MASFFSRLRDVFRQPEQRRRGGAAAFFGNFGGSALIGTGLGRVSAELAENISAVSACIQAISGPISSVPATVFRSFPGGRVEAPDHPVARLIRSPNPRQTYEDWMTWTLGQVLTHGNAISRIERNADGEPIGLHPIPFEWVQPYLTSSGRMAFDVSYSTLPFANPVVPVQRLLEDEIFWLRDRSDDSYLGKSPLHRAPMVLKSALGIQEFISNLWDRAAMPSGFLSTAHSLSPEAAKRLGQSWADTYGGVRNVGRVPVLEAGLKFEPAAMKPLDAEVLESRRFSVIEIARLMGVPAQIIGSTEMGSFSNMETAGRWFVSLCLGPWARRIESEFQRSVFGVDDDCHLFIDLSSLQRSDDLARWQTFAIAIDKGILTVNEVRSEIGANKMPDAPGVAEVLPGAGTGP